MPRTRQNNLADKHMNPAAKDKLDQTTYPHETDSPSAVFYIVAGVVFILAGLLRFIALRNRPFHNDEGVNGFFLNNLFVHNNYAYNPSNYHGPSIYYIALPFVYLFGTSMDTLRSVTVLFSLITLWQVLNLRKRIGINAAVFAAMLLVVSPGAVFYARYFIHETLVVCFTLGTAMTAWDYWEKRMPNSLLLCSIYAGLLFATKETAALECAILAIAAVLARVWVNPKPQIDVIRGSEDSSRIESNTLILWAGAIAIFLSINVILYSSAFTHLQGIVDAIHSPLYWFRRTGNEHVHPIWQYLDWMRRGDPILLIVGLAGSAIVLIERKNRFSIFVAFWTLGTILAYSLMGYKTPWLVLNMLVPMAIMGGVLISNFRGLAFQGLTVLIVCGISFFYCVDLNFYKYDDDREPYVYAQTVRDYFRLVGSINAYSVAHADQGETSIAVISPDYWPLPWDLRRDSNSGYFNGPSKIPENAKLVVASSNQAPQLLRIGFKLDGIYTLRPAVNVELWERKMDGGDSLPPKFKTDPILKSQSLTNSHPSG